MIIGKSGQQRGVEGNHAAAREGRRYIIGPQNAILASQIAQPLAQYQQRAPQQAATEHPPQRAQYRVFHPELDQEDTSERQRYTADPDHPAGGQFRLHRLVRLIVLRSR